MDRRAMMFITLGVLVAVLLVAVTTAAEVPLAERAPSISWEPGRLEPPDLEQAPEGGERQDRTDQDDDRLSPLVRSILRIILYTAVGALTALVAWYAWRRRPDLEWRRSTLDDFDVLDDIAASMAADADELRAALERGTPRNAIVECWLRLERMIVASGVERDPADTSTELTARVLSRFDIEPPAIHELSALYREARFSTHRVDEASRDRAIAALDAVHDGLRRGTKPARTDPAVPEQHRGAPTGRVR